MASYLTTIAIYDAISVAEARPTGSHQPFRFCSLQHSGFAFTATRGRAHFANLLPIRNWREEADLAETVKFGRDVNLRGVDLMGDEVSK